MKAIVYTQYGSPDVLQFKDVEKPTPKDNQILVKVHAAALNAADLDLLRGTFLIRLGGPRKPMYSILGSDIAGRVEAIGKNVTSFHIGDEVYADLTESGFGAFAEYVCVPETMLSLKPANTTFEEAAAIPSAAVIALQGLRDKKPVQSGQKILINGAGGSVGIYGIQLAKLWGAEVTGVDTGAKLDLMRGLGADEVLDYTQIDFTKTGRHYDLILDVVANRSMSDYKRALTATGTFVLIGGTISALLQTFVVGGWMSKRGQQKLGVLLLDVNQKDLGVIKGLLEAGQLKTVIDRRYSLSETAEAFHYLESGKAQGKIVITIAQ